MGDSKSCVDLTVTGQSDLVIKSGVYPLLHESVITKQFMKNYLCHV